MVHLPLDDMTRTRKSPTLFLGAGNKFVGVRLSKGFFTKWGVVLEERFKVSLKDFNLLLPPANCEDSRLVPD